MFTPSLATNRSAAQALSRVVQALKDRQYLTPSLAIGLDLEELAPKSLMAVIPKVKPRGVFASYFSADPTGANLPLERLTVAGALLAHAMLTGSGETRGYCDFVAAQFHDHVPVAILPHKHGAWQGGMNILQMVAQWRWRGQASPLAIDVDMGHMVAALQRHPVVGLDQDIGRVAAWCVTHDWGECLGARSGLASTGAFIALVKAGAVVENVNALAFPDQLDMRGRLPVLLAVMRHAVPEQLPQLVDMLLKQGAEPDAASSHGKTALMACVDPRLGEHAGAVAMKLLAAGASANMRNKNGFTVLEQMAAAEKAEASLVQRIVPLATETKPTRFRDPIVSAIKSSLARGTAMSVLAEIDNEMSIA